MLEPIFFAFDVLVNCSYCRTEFTKMEKTEESLKGKYPAKAHAAKVAAYLKSKDPSADGLIYLEGQKTRMIEDNDEPVPFRSVLHLHPEFLLCIPNQTLLG